MRASLLHCILAIGAIVATVPALAHERGHDRAPASGAEPALREVPHEAGPGQPGHGWRYFSDARAHRAVVIDPDGTYYYSRGRGLHPVSGPGANA